jgi:hypothetical protein
MKALPLIPFLFVFIFNVGGQRNIVGKVPPDKEGSSYIIKLRIIILVYMQEDHLNGTATSSQRNIAELSQCPTGLSRSIYLCC